jgi:autotransporter adhesin
MNRFYKSIWNDSLGAWIAASELSNSRGGKSKSLRAVVACAAVGLTLASQMATAQVAGLVNPCTGASLPRSAITGLLNPVLNPLTAAVDILTFTLPGVGLNSIWSNLADGNPIGLNVLDTQGNILSVNQDCKVIANEYSISRPAGVAIGGNKITGLGTNGGTPAVANELTSVAIGNGADTATGATNALALGENAKVQTGAPNSVALGAGSVATAPNTVSVGQVGTERRIVNVADGIGSTDAANMGQLSAVSGLAGNSVQYDNPGKTSVTLGGATALAPVVLGNVAEGALSANSSEAVNGSQLFTTNGNVATNTTNINNLGDSINQGTIGLVQQAAPGANLTVGRNTSGGAVDFFGTAGNRRLINVADGIDSTDAANMGQLSAVSGLAGNSVQYDNPGKTSVTLGGAGALAPVVLGNVAEGALSANSSEAVNGSQLFTTNGNVATNTTNIAGNTTSIANLDGRVTANTTDIANNTTAINNLGDNISQGKIGLVQQATADANLTVGKSTGGTAVDLQGTAGNRKLINMAAGTDDGDAVNLSQLKAVSTTAANSVQYDNLEKTSITLGGAGGTAIGNVKAGEVSATSAQAVNGAQLSATNSAIGSVDARVTNLAGDTSTAYTVTSGKGIRYARTNENGLPQLDAFAQAAGATAVGYNATASAENAVAIGRDANAGTADAVAIGHGAVARDGKAVSIGAQNIASGNGAVAIGDPNIATGAGAVAIGQNNTATGQGAVATGNANQATGAGSVAIGDANKATGQTSVAVGSNAVANGASAIAFGQAAVASAANSVALGAGAVAVRGAQTGYAAIGVGAGQNSAGEVSVGNAGSERQLTSVAPGSAGTDAVNVNQLNGVTAGIGNYVNNVVRRIDDVEKNADAGTAGAMAMAGMPQAFTPGKNMLAAGAASYQGQTSLAVGLSRLSDNGKWVMKVNGAANSRGKVGLAVGAGYQW